MLSYGTHATTCHSPIQVYASVQALCVHLVIKNCLCRVAAVKLTKRTRCPDLVICPEASDTHFLCACELDCGMTPGMIPV